MESIKQCEKSKGFGHTMKEGIIFQQLHWTTTKISTDGKKKKMLFFVSSSSSSVADVIVLLLWQAAACPHDQVSVDYFVFLLQQHPYQQKQYLICFTTF